ncbi:MAG: DUF971 domain-containing protein [Acidimicrobiia bacterium]
MRTEPVGVEIDREQGLTLTWPDRMVHTFELAELRANCPCAECRGLRETGRPVWPTASSPRPLAVVDAELVGAWGLSIRWNDGHGTGIYPWELLRAWRDELDG